MKKEIKESIDNIFWKTIWMIIVFAFLNFLFLYLFKNYTIVKDTLSNTIGFSSAAATLAAALIAANLFNDWKDQHNATMYSRFAIEIIETIKNISSQITALEDLWENIKSQQQLNNFNPEESYKIYSSIRYEIQDQSRKLLHDVIFFSNLTSDKRILETTLLEVGKIRKSHQDFCTYITMKGKTTLNEIEFIEHLKIDKKIFFDCNVSILNNLLPLINSYISKI